MNYIQQTSFSNSAFGRDLCRLVGSYGLHFVRKAFEEASDKVALEAAMRSVIDLEFVPLAENPNKGEDIPYMSIDKAFRDLPLYTLNSSYFGSEERKRHKLGILLVSVTFLESDALFRICTGKYDKESIREYLFPKKKQRNQSLIAK